MGYSVSYAFEHIEDENRTWIGIYDSKDEDNELSELLTANILLEQYQTPKGTQKVASCLRNVIKNYQNSSKVVTLNDFRPLKGSQVKYKVAERPEENDTLVSIYQVDEKSGKMLNIMDIFIQNAYVEATRALFESLNRAIASELVKNKRLNANKKTAKKKPAPKKAPTSSAC